MTNRQAHEEAAGMNLEDAFFTANGIDPDATCPEEGELVVQAHQYKFGDFYVHNADAATACTLQTKLVDMPEVYGMGLIDRIIPILHVHKKLRAVGTIF
jgi:hypothetical protein